MPGVALLNLKRLALSFFVANEIDVLVKKRNIFEGLSDFVHACVPLTELWSIGSGRIQERFGVHVFKSL